jgi:hypothetical protein
MAHPNRNQSPGPRIPEIETVRRTEHMRRRQLFSLCLLFVSSSCALTRHRASTRTLPLLTSAAPNNRLEQSSLLQLRGGSKKKRSDDALKAVSTLRGGASILDMLGNAHSKLSLAGAPPFVLACAIFSAMDSLLLGYDIGCISGILLYVQEDFGLSSAQAEAFAAAMNSAAIFGALVSGWIADRFGRKPALFMSSFTFALGSTLMAVAGSYDALVRSRWIQGFGVGSGLLISPMFISEVSPKRFRGALVTLSEVSLSFGILLAFLLNYLLSGIKNQWRYTPPPAAPLLSRAFSVAHLL